MLHRYKTQQFIRFGFYKKSHRFITVFYPYILPGRTVYQNSFLNLPKSPFFSQNNPGIGRVISTLGKSFSCIIRGNKFRKNHYRINKKKDDKGNKCQGTSLYIGKESSHLMPPFRTGFWDQQGQELYQKLPFPKAPEKTQT